MKAAVLFVAVLSIARWWHDTNSHAASARGRKAYAEGKYAEAVKEFARALELAPSSRNAFNLGTSQIAAGRREQGSSTLSEVIKDPALRADALFNRGNSALAAKAFDHAIADYSEVLKLRPRDLAAKRNLEIAYARRESARRQSASGKDQNQPGKNDQQQPRPSPSAGNQKAQPDIEALLRSVQQQEQEELRRMKGKAAEGRVGW
jgi:Ca-activated chloride channel homolog